MSLLHDALYVSPRWRERYDKVPNLEMISYLLKRGANPNFIATRSTVSQDLDRSYINYDKSFSEKHRLFNRICDSVWRQLLDNLLADHEKDQKISPPWPAIFRILLEHDAEMYPGPLGHILQIPTPPVVITSTSVRSCGGWARRFPN